MPQLRSTFTTQLLDGSFTPPENRGLAATLNAQGYNDDTGVFAAKRALDINCYMHWHDVLELEMFIGGEGTLQVNDRIYEIKPGLVNFVNYRDFHEIILKKPVTLYHLHFENIAVDSGLLGRLLNDEQFVCQLTPSDTEAMEHLFEEMISGQSVPADRRRLYMTSLLTALIIRFIGCFETSPLKGHVIDTAGTGIAAYGGMTSERTARNGRGEKRFLQIQSAVDYINSHFTEKLTMAGAARLFYMQEQYFSAKFHEITGVTFTEYLRNLRLEYADGLLRHSDHTVKQIAAESGYGSYSSFMRDFSRYFGSTPMKVRRSAGRSETIKLKIKPDGDHSIRTITPVGK